jgi:hypothetical protein
MADIDHDTITRWQASRSKAEQVAARLAAELRGKPRWDPVDGNHRIAARMDVSEATARRAKVLLAGHGAIMQDARNRAAGYYVT